MEYVDGSFSKPTVGRDKCNIHIIGQEISCYDHFHYLGSIVHQDGEIEEDVWIELK